MRFEVVIGGVCAAGVALAVVACGSSDSTSTNPDDGSSGGETNGSSSGGSSSGKTSSSSGASSGTTSSGGSSGTASSSGTITIAPTSLKAGGALLLGVTDDDQAIYVTIGGATSDIEAIPLAGGTAVKVATDFDVQNDAVVISGSAVGWWTGITNDIGTFNVWNKTDGAKTALSTTSAAGIFAASSDGLRVVWSTAADATNTNLRVSNVATAVSGTGFLSATEKVNLAALGGATPTCNLDMSFVGKRLFAAFCTGTSATATAAHLYTVPDASTTEVRLDDKGTAAGDIQPFWLSDDAGTKLFVIGPTPTATGRVIDVAATTSFTVEDGTARAGFVTKDGSALVYRTATGGIKRTVTTASTPKTLVAGAKGFLDTSTDQTKILFRTLDPTQEGVDIRSGDSTTENQTAKDIVTTASADPLGFTGSAGNVVYVVSAGAGVSLKSKPAAGGTEKELAKDMDSVGMMPEGDGLIVLENGVAQGQLTLYSVRYINASTGVASKTISDGIPDSGFALHKKKLVYTKIAQTGAGLFVADLP